MSTIRERAEQLAKDILLPWEVEQSYVVNVTEMIEKALEKCATLAEQAKLPRGFQWGHDAMEQFNFGKERAAAAIREGTANPRYKP